MILGPAAVLCAAATWACSSSSSNGDTGGGDGGNADGQSQGDGPGGGSSLVTCGSPPYITLGLTVEAASTGTTAPHIPGAVLTSPLCPDASFTADDDGGIAGLVSKDVAFYGRFAAAGYAQTLSPEQDFDADTELAIVLPPSLLTAIVPGYDQNKPTIFVEVIADGGHKHDGGSDCTDPSGISFTVQDHPEAQITYYSADSIPAPVAGTSTTGGGKASIVGVDSSASPVTLVGTKTGCTVSFVKDSSTGRIPLENGYVSIAGAYLRD